ncbi:unnamed protein product [Rotaria sp. Silwood1]|nr:unnamed protein product [Rotaria sp. Silwood1]CAF4845994.1 unnamed protein product [Rotaria sp. Silwood1]CAF5100671.1 unnamed protein product [Rotaria sp. Silwood1]
MRRNRLRWLRLQDNYHFINISSLWTPPRNYNRPKLIYKCKSFCGGLGDRFRGIITCFILSLISDRQFMIDMTHPVDVKNYLLPNIYNWTLDNQTSNMNLSHIVIHAIDSEPNFENQIRNTAFMDTWAKYDDIEIYTNLDLVADIFRNPLIRNNTIIAMFLLNLPLEQLTLHSLFPFLFEILFQPSFEVINALQPILQDVENGYQLICIHLRMGQNPSNPLDASFGDRASAVEDIIDFLNRTKLQKMRNTRVFVTSDSEQALSKIVRQFSNQTITISGPIIHVDRPVNNIHFLHGFLKVVIDFYMLGECHMSILTASGFSALANRRRTEPYQKLFKYDGLNRRIERCHDIYEYTQPPITVKVGWYCRVVFNCSSREM